MKGGLKELILKSFLLPENYSMLFMNNILLDNLDKEDTNWLNIINALNEANNIVSKWTDKNLNLAIEFTIASINVNYLGNKETALNQLLEAKDKFSTGKGIIYDRLASIYMDNNDYENAAKEILFAIKWTKKGKEGCYNTLEVLRKAGIIYFNLGEYSRSAKFFLKGYFYSKKYKKNESMAAFLGDASFAYWKTEDKYRMLYLLNISLKIIRKYYKSPSENIKLYTIFRNLGVIVQWLTHTLDNKLKWDDNSQRPYPGMCSSVNEGNEKLLGLPEIHPDALTFLLIDIEKKLQVQNITTEIQNEPKDKKVLLSYLHKKIDEAYKKVDFDDLPKLIYDFTDCYLSIENSFSKNIKTIKEISIKEVFPKNVWNYLEYNQVGLYYIFAALLKSFLLNQSLEDIFTKWLLITAKEEKYTSFNELIEKLERIYIAKDKRPFFIDKENNAIINANIAALFYVLGNHNYEPIYLMSSHYYLWNIFYRNRKKLPDIEKYFSILVSENWKKQSELRFLFRMPQFYVPRLIEKCNIKEESFNKIASILLTAAEATGFKFPDDIKQLLTHLSQ